MIDELGDILDNNCNIFYGSPDWEMVDGKELDDVLDTNYSSCDGSLDEHLQNIVGMYKLTPMDNKEVAQQLVELSYSLSNYGALDFNNHRYNIAADEKNDDSEESVSNLESPLLPQEETTETAPRRSRLLRENKQTNMPN